MAGPSKIEAKLLILVSLANRHNVGLKFSFVLDKRLSDQVCSRLLTFRSLRRSTTFPTSLAPHDPLRTPRPTRERSIAVPSDKKPYGRLAVTGSRRPFWAVLQCSLLSSFCSSPGIMSFPSGPAGSRERTFRSQGGSIEA